MKKRRKRIARSKKVSLPLLFPLFLFLIFLLLFFHTAVAPAYDSESESDSENETNRRAPSGGMSGKNKLLAVGFNHDRSFIVRGDNIGVFRHTDDDKLKYNTTISKVATTKGKRFAPTKVYIFFFFSSLFRRLGSRRWRCLLTPMIVFVVVVVERSCFTIKINQ